MSTVGPTEPVLTAKAFLFPSCNIIKNKFRSRIDVLYVGALFISEEGTGNAHSCS